MESWITVPLHYLHQVSHYKISVLVSTFLVQAVFGGGVFGIPRMTMVIVETFHGTRAQAGAVIATMNAVRNCIGVVCGSFVHMHGTRNTGALGSCLIALGFCASFFATSIGFLVVSIGIFTGIGLALIYVCCPPVVCDAFEKRRQYSALTFMSCGSSVGGMVFSYSIGYALDMYGIRGTCLLMGGVTLNVIAFSLQWADQSNQRKGNYTLVKGTRHATNDQALSEPSQFNIYKSIIMVKPFALAAFGLTLSISAYVNAYIYLIDTFGGTDDTYARTLTPILFSCFGLIGRFLSVSLKYLFKCSTLDIPLLSTVAGIVGSFLIAFGDSVAVKVVGWCLTGMALGVLLTSIQLVTVDLLEQNHVAHGLGMILTMNGVGLLLGGPLNGLIRDMLGSYTAVFMFTAVSVVVGGVSMLAAKILRAGQVAVVI